MISIIARIYKIFVFSVFDSPVAVPEDVISITFKLAQREDIQEPPYFVMNLFREFYAYRMRKSYNNHFKDDPFAYLRELPEFLVERYRDGWDFFDFEKCKHPVWIVDLFLRTFLTNENSRLSLSLSIYQTGNILGYIRCHLIRNFKDGNEKQFLKTKIFEKALPYIFSQPASILEQIICYAPDMPYAPGYLYSAFKGKHFKYIRFMIQHSSYKEAAFLFSNALECRELSFEQVQILYEEDNFVRTLIDDYHIDESKCENRPLPLLLKEAKLMTENPKYYTQAGRRFLRLRRLNVLTPEDTRFFTQNNDFMRHCKVIFGKTDTSAENGCNCLVS